MYKCYGDRNATRTFIIIKSRDQSLIIHELNNLRLHTKIHLNSKCCGDRDSTRTFIKIKSRDQSLIMHNLKNEIKVLVKLTIISWPKL